MFMSISLTTTHEISKGIIGLCVGIFCALVGYNNIVDFNSNYQFVQHVLAMDSLEPWFDGKALMGRAITDETFHFIGYCGVIIGEISAGLFCIYGSIKMLRNIRRPEFETGQAFYIIGCTIAALVWYFGFAIVGAEWFQMWASQWNGQMKAYAFITFILLTMVYIIIPPPRRH